LAELARDLRFDGLALDVVPVDNSLFGGQVSVAGLVAGADIVRALRGRGADRVILPRVMFDTAGRRTIDGWSVERIADALGTEVTVASSAEELIERTLGGRNEPNAAQGRITCAAL
jgi:NifB/MoaA-like Fe-S oxidoreductase